MHTWTCNGEPVEAHAIFLQLFSVCEANGWTKPACIISCMRKRQNVSCWSFDWECIGVDWRSRVFQTVASRSLFAVWPKHTHKSHYRHRHSCRSAYQCLAYAAPQNNKATPYIHVLRTRLYYSYTHILYMSHLTNTIERYTRRSVSAHSCWQRQQAGKTHLYAACLYVSVCATV